MRYIAFSFVVLGVLAGSPGHAAEQGSLARPSPSASLGAEPVVTSVSGQEVVLDAGADAGIRKGDLATAYFSLRLAGQAVQVRVAELEITGVEATTCRARITNRRAEVQPGYRVLFHRSLQPPEGVERTLARPAPPEGGRSGSVHVASRPSGGDVLLDGQLVAGKTPLALKDLPVGPHVVEVRLQGIAAASHVEVGDGAPVLLELALVPAEGALQLESTPSGARVRVDGIERGVTPCLVANLAAGGHLVQVDKPGLVPESRVVVIPEDDVAHKRATQVALRLSSFGKLRLSGNPSDATVSVDGAPRCGVLPCLIDLAPGRHLLVATRAGYLDQRQELEAKADGFEDLELRLEALPVVEVESNPPGARVTLDGQEVGLTPLAMSLERPGSVKVGLNMEGRRPVEYVVEARPGDVAHLGGDLLVLNQEIPRARRVTALIVGVSGAALAVGGGVLLFLADRQDRRADDLHQQYLTLPKGLAPEAYQSAYARVQDAVSTSHTEAIAGYCLLGVGAGAAVYAAITGLGFSGAATPPANVRPALMPGGGGMVWEGTW
jgi:hypothetical protein